MATTRFGRRQVWLLALGVALVAGAWVARQLQPTPAQVASAALRDRTPPDGKIEVLGTNRMPRSGWLFDEWTAVAAVIRADGPPRLVRVEVHRPAWFRAPYVMEVHEEVLVAPPDPAGPPKP